MSADLRKPGTSTATRASSIAAAASAVLLVAMAVAILPLTFAAHEPIGWLLLAVAFLVGGSFDVETYAYLIYHVGDHGLPLAHVAVFLSPCYYLGVALLPLPVLIFPDGRLPSARWRPVLWLYAAGASVTLVTVAWLDVPSLYDRTIQVDGSGEIRAIDYPTGWESLALHASILLLLVLSVAFALRQILALRSASGLRREQLKAMHGGGAICVAGIALSIVLGAIPGHGYVLSNPSFLLINALPIGIGIGILRYRLYEIDRVISRTPAYSGLTSVLIGLYLCTVTLATLLAAALFNPLRARIQRLVDRRFNRTRYDADAIDIETVQGQLAAAVSQAVAPSHVSTWIRPPTSGIES